MKNYEELKSQFKEIVVGTALEGVSRKLYRFIFITRQRGLSTALVTTLRWIFGVRGMITFTKERVLTHLLDIHGGVVAYGKFKGMKLSRNAYWGGYDVIAKILGVYEEHVTKKIFEFSKVVRGPFVDIGAADGYFAIGVALSGQTEMVYAYEISDKGRDALASNAQLNNCSEKINIEAEANFESLSKLMSKHHQALVLIDIEGAEYDFLAEPVLNVLRQCYIIIELHPWMVEDGYKKQNSLLRSAEQFFNVQMIERESYSPNQFNELREFSDDERLLAMSEGRGKNMQWLVMSPK